MEEKIENSIFLHQGIINELEEVLKRVETSETEKIRFRVETKHWYGFSEPLLLWERTPLRISKKTMQVILNEAINKERERINKLIDMEIDRRISNVE